MNKRLVGVSTLVILLALLSFILEVCLYYFISEHIVAVLAAIGLSVALSHYFLELSLDYDSCFLQAAFMTIASAAFAVVVYLMQPNEWISFDFWILVLVLMNWLVPFIYCFIRDFADRGPRFGGYIFFFHGMSVVFLSMYVLLIAKELFVTPMLPPYPVMEFGAHNFIPFMATGNYLEGVIGSGGNTADMVIYIVQMVIFAIPYGFYAKVYTRELPFILRLLAYMGGPLIIELLQLITGLGRADMDDYAFAIIGILIGTGIYQLVYYVSYETNKRDFLEDRTVAKSLLFHF